MIFNMFNMICQTALLNVGNNLTWYRPGSFDMPGKTYMQMRLNFFVIYLYIVF